MSFDYNTVSELASKVNFEGGVTEAFDYGVRASDIANTPELADVKSLWSEMEANYIEVQPLVDKLQSLLDEADPEEGDDYADGPGNV